MILRLKENILLMILSAVVGSITTATVNHVTMGKDITRLATIMEIYVPATDKRIIGVENLTAINAKRMNRAEVDIARHLRNN